MSIDRAKALLASTDVTDNRNGAALIINAGATSANVPEILNQGIINLLLPKLRSDNSDLVMKACWAVNNLCVHEKSRDAIFNGGVLEYMPAVLRHTDPEVLKKAAWALTNISRSEKAQKEMVRHGTFKSLITLLTGSNDDVRGAILQPLCNLVLDAENQNEFLRQGGIQATTQLLSSRDEKSRELAVTLISFVTTNHDSVRNVLVDAGVFRPLKNLVEGAGTPKEQEYALNALVNISLSDQGEVAVADQDVLPAVVGLLSSSQPKLRQQAAMLLSNLLTNKKVREKIRYVGWVDPVLDIAKGDDPGLLQQILRVMINVAFDGHCRALLVKRQGEKIVHEMTKRVSDPTVQSLATTALKNLSVPVATDIQSEVEEALRSGKALNRIAPPEARRKAAIDDLAALDDLVGDISRGKREHKVSGAGSATSDSTASRPAPSALRSVEPVTKKSNAMDEIVFDLAPPPRAPPGGGKPSAPPPAKSTPPAKGRDALDDLLNDLPPPRSQKKANLDDIDALLAGTGSSSKSAPPPPPPANRADDLDALLSDIPRKSNTPKKNVATDDIDDLLSNLDKPRGKPAANDDIDSLLAGVGSAPAGGRRDEIDDLLSGIDGGGSKKSGMDAIDDLLADLTS